VQKYGVTSAKPSALLKPIMVFMTKLSEISSANRSLLCTPPTHAPNAGMTLVANNSMERMTCS
jgi:hypothetical protein